MRLEAGLLPWSCRVSVVLAARRVCRWAFHFHSRLKGQNWLRLYFTLLCLLTAYNTHITKKQTTKRPRVQYHYPYCATYSCLISHAHPTTPFSLPQSYQHNSPSSPFTSSSFPSHNQTPTQKHSKSTIQSPPTSTP